jgi:hypothetical protein
VASHPAGSPDPWQLLDWSRTAFATIITGFGQLVPAVNAPSSLAVPPAGTVTEGKRALESVGITSSG